MSIKNLILRYNMIYRMKQRTLRNRLINKQFTLLSSNCLGGLIYHEFGLKFLSPTVNLRFSSKEFVKFVVNIEEYLKLNFVEIPTEKSYLIGMLGDITVHFVHYSSFEEAVNKWKERCKRINWDNTFVLLNDCDGIDESDLALLDQSKLKNIVVFTAKKYPNSRSAVYLSKYAGSKNVGNVMKKNIITGEMECFRFFDFAAWFNDNGGKSAEYYSIE